MTRSLTTSRGPNRKSFCCDGSSSQGHGYGESYFHSLSSDVVFRFHPRDFPPMARRQTLLAPAEALPLPCKVAMAIRNLEACGELSSSPAEIQAMAPPAANSGAAAQPKRSGKPAIASPARTRLPEQDYR